MAKDRHNNEYGAKITIDSQATLKETLPTLTFVTIAESFADDKTLLRLTILGWHT